MKFERSSGVLLHISSLPGPYGIGDLGPSAYEFVDFLHDAGQKYWQILPLSPTRIESGNSPYSSPSAFAGNPLFISPEALVSSGYLASEEVPSFENSSPSQIDFQEAIGFKKKLFGKLFEKYPHQSQRIQSRMEEFRQHNAYWLEDFCLYSVLADHLNGRWTEWPEDLKRREKLALNEVREKYRDEILQEEWLQFLFYEQWNALKSYAHQKGILIFGDLPLYVSGLSADCWSHPHYFQLDEELHPAMVSGVPPDLFSETGQLWGTPVYDWATLEKDRFQWWVSRLEQNLKLFDLVRIDHFRGLSAYWGVPGDHKTAEAGQWIEAPGDALFTQLRKEFPDMPFIAEDLGEIDQPVFDLRDSYDLPGMNILQYAFGGKEGEERFIPYTYVRNSVTYTGTHDNDTTRGWYQKTSPEVQERLQKYVGCGINPFNVSEHMMRLAYRSVSHLTIIPMQDILGLDSEAMMNRPGIADGNWTWRLEEGNTTPELAKWLAEMMILYGRKKQVRVK